MLSGFDLKRVDRVKRVALETKLEGVIDEDWKRLVTRESIRQIIINAMEMVYQPKRTEEELDLQERIVQVRSMATSS